MQTSGIARFLFAWLALAVVPAHAETRRALLVGIDTYASTLPAGSSSAGGRPRDAWTDLDGAVNDAEELKAVLVARYGFRAEDVHVLTNSKATRDRILTDIRTWLIDGAAPGDVSVFFFAGHGSQVKNSASDEADKLDESIVPADVNRGARDIRDKELAALFAHALDKQVKLTLMFDSCHSGSIGRGAPRVTRARFIAPDLRDVADSTRPVPLEQRGALILSASQDYQLAAEAPDETARPHGLFTWALLKTLRSMPVNQSADRAYLQIRALMQSAEVFQEPVLATTADRRRGPLFGVGVAAPASGLAVAVERVEADGSVILQAGIGAGLHKDAVLRRAAQNASAALRLRIVEEQGLSRSRAVAIGAQSTRTLRPGMLFEVERWTSTSGAALRLWLGSVASNIATVRTQALAVASFAASPPPGVTVISDPTIEDTPADLLRWTGSNWQLVTHDGAAKDVGYELGAAALSAAIGTTAHSRVMPSVPLPAEVAGALDLGKGSANDAIDVLPTAEHADYVLIGRAEGSRIEYAWIRPGVSAQDGAASPLPVRTEWMALDDRHPEALAEQLRARALRLDVLKSWLQLESPPGSEGFPYHLALVDEAGALRTAGPIRDGEHYTLVLSRDVSQRTTSPERRFVYVFTIDSYGECTLQLPSPAAGAVENLLPVPGSDSAIPDEIPLFVLTVTAPYGAETFVLLTSATQLADPMVLEGEAVRGGGPTHSSSEDALSRLISQTQSGKRGGRAETPTDWSIERLTILSSSREPL